MSKDIKVEPYYKKQANDLTNLLFDKGFLQPMLTRESIDWLEDYIGFILQSQCQMSAKAAILTAKHRHRIAKLRTDKED